MSMTEKRRWLTVGQQALSRRIKIKFESENRVPIISRFACDNEAIRTDNNNKYFELQAFTEHRSND